jgi:hypothetical protein
LSQQLKGQLWQQHPYSPVSTGVFLGAIMAAAATVQGIADQPQGLANDSDIAIICPNGRQLLCHRTILAMRSKKLAAVFASSECVGRESSPAGLFSHHALQPSNVAYNTLVLAWARCQVLSATGHYPLYLVAPCGCAQTNSQATSSQFQGWTAGR